MHAAQFFLLCLCEIHWSLNISFESFLQTLSNMFQAVIYITMTFMYNKTTMILLYYKYFAYQDQYIYIKYWQVLPNKGLNVKDKQKLSWSSCRVPFSVLSWKLISNPIISCQKQLEDEASMKPNQPQKEEPPILEPKPKSVVQIVFEENKVWCHYCM